MERILVSACLMGQRVRYDGGDNDPDSAWLSQWQAEGRLVTVCPEVAGGLPTPRPPAEIQHGTGIDVLNQRANIITVHGDDVTEAFVKGAYHALKVAQANECHYAVLAARSPSCGNREIYDGHFQGKLIDGQGTTAALLEEHGIHVFNPTELEHLAALLAETSISVATNRHS